jgi:hypothetical protein
METGTNYHLVIIWARMDRDPSLGTLLLLDGERFIVESGCWVKFEVKQVPTSVEKPHGLEYSLTLHDSENERLLGFDNAHPIRQGSGPGAGRVSNMTTSTRASAFASMTIRMPSPC